MKALVGTFNQEKALVGAFSVIVKIDCGTDGSFYSTSLNPGSRKTANHSASEAWMDSSIAQTRYSNFRTYPWWLLLAPELLL